MSFWNIVQGWIYCIKPGKFFRNKFQKIWISEKIIWGKIVILIFYKEIKSSLGKNRILWFFSLGNTHCKNFQTLYESCKDPQICIFKNYKHAAGIWRKILIIISFFKKLVKWQHLNTGSIGFALISECKSDAHKLSFNFCLCEPPSCYLVISKNLWSKMWDMNVIWDM